MSLPRIAALVPVYNRPHAVVEALASIAAQTLAPARLVVVDDGSTDGTAEEIRAWIRDARPRFDVRLIRQDNAGVAAARNRAVADAADCELLAFLDSDDLWPADYLERMAAVLGGDDRLVAASGDLLVQGPGAGAAKLLDCRGVQGAATAVLLRGGQAYPSATVVRATAFHAAGGFDPRYRVFEDHDLFLRMSLLGLWAHVAGAPVTRRRGIDRTHGDAVQLTRTYESPEQRAVALRVVRRFLHGGRARAVPAKLRHQALGQLWYQLGRAHIKARQPAAALRCFRNAVRRDPWHRRAWRRLTATRLRLALGPKEE